MFAQTPARVVYVYNALILLLCFSRSLQYKTKMAATKKYDIKQMTQHLLYSGANIRRAMALFILAFGEGFWTDPGLFKNVCVSFIAKFRAI